MPKLIENARFDSAAYEAKISNPAYTLKELALNIYRKRRAITTAKVQVAGGVVMAPVTVGLSLIGSAVGLRTLDVEEQKLHLLQVQWACRGQHPLPTRYIKDTLIPIVITTSLGLLGFFLDFGAATAVFQQAMYHLGDTLHVSAATSGVAQRAYDSLVGPAYQYMGQNLGTKVMDGQDRHSGVDIPMAYSHSPQPG
ncbi:hypothetical protein ONZ45_g10232 [Pleurotus djamor]|nr:hypothetical protein ONZ45_g10232 [Pleurotus djamor]